MRNNSQIVWGLKRYLGRESFFPAAEEGWLAHRTFGTSLRWWDQGAYLLFLWCSSFCWIGSAELSNLRRGTARPHLTCGRPPEGANPLLLKKWVVLGGCGCFTGDVLLGMFYFPPPGGDLTIINPFAPTEHDQVVTSCSVGFVVFYPGHIGPGHRSYCVAAPT